MVLIKEKFMTILDKTECQDKYGNCVEFESEAYGCKITSKISQPDMVLLGAEVGGNLDMTGDGHIVGEKMLCDKCFIAKIKATRKARSFTVIGFTDLLIQPSFCIVIIEG